MSRGWMRFLVPRGWSGEQALLAASLLRQALDALWSVHGEEMAANLYDWPRERWSEVMSDEYLDTHEDDIPF